MDEQRRYIIICVLTSNPVPPLYIADTTTIPLSKISSKSHPIFGYSDAHVRGG